MALGVSARHNWLWNTPGSIRANILLYFGFTGKLNRVLGTVLLSLQIGFRKMGWQNAHRKFLEPMWSWTQWSKKFPAGSVLRETITGSSYSIMWTGMTKRGLI